MLKPLVLLLTLLACMGTAPLAGELLAPDAALKTSVSQLLGDLKQHSARYRSDEISFFHMVDQVVVPRFDVPGIAKFALGRNGRSATPDQRTRFADALTLMLVHSYAKFMLRCQDSISVVWNPVRMEAGADRAKINTLLTGNCGGQYPVGFSVHLVDGDWKIYDLEIDGVSLALNYRVQLNSEIRRTSLDAVIARMTKKGLGRGTAAVL